ncbi:MAG: hypothetical protein NC236_00620 [Mycoplasma sp.]|nr:hypothetical protein [Mycoplasma sp.]
MSLIVILVVSLLLIVTVTITIIFLLQKYRKSNRRDDLDKLNREVISPTKITWIKKRYQRFTFICNNKNNNKIELFGNRILEMTNLRKKIIEINMKNLEKEIQNSNTNKYDEYLKETKIEISHLIKLSKQLDEDLDKELYIDTQISTQNNLYTISFQEGLKVYEEKKKYIEFPVKLIEHRINKINKIRNAYKTNYEAGELSKCITNLDNVKDLIIDFLKLINKIPFLHVMIYSEIINKMKSIKLKIIEMQKMRFPNQKILEWKNKISINKELYKELIIEYKNINIQKIESLIVTINKNLHYIDHDIKLEKDAQILFKKKSDDLKFIIMKTHEKTKTLEKEINFFTANAVIVEPEIYEYVDKMKILKEDVKKSIKEIEFRMTNSFIETIEEVKHIIKIHNDLLKVINKILFEIFKADSNKIRLLNAREEINSSYELILLNSRERNVYISDDEKKYILKVKKLINLFSELIEKAPFPLKEAEKLEKRLAENIFHLQKTIGIKNEYSKCITELINELGPHRANSHTIDRGINSAQKYFVEGEYVKSLHQIILTLEGVENNV